MTLRIIGLATAAASLALTGAQTAGAKPGDGAKELRQNLRATVTKNDPPGQSARPDPDMGDDNAAERAIFVVCVRNGPPSSERSAICDGEPITA